MSHRASDRPARLRLAAGAAALPNGGESIAMLPTRYPGSERSDDGAIVMARKTEWRLRHGSRPALVRARPTRAHHGSRRPRPADGALDRVRGGAGRRRNGVPGGWLWLSFIPGTAFNPPCSTGSPINIRRSARSRLEARVLTRQQLRSAVLRDLSWLFNATRPEPEAASTRTQEIELWAASQARQPFGAELRHARLFRKHHVLAEPAGDGSGHPSSAICHIRAAHRSANRCR